MASEIPVKLAAIKDYELTEVSILTFILHTRRNQVCKQSTAWTVEDA